MFWVLKWQLKGVDDKGSGGGVSEVSLEAETAPASGRRIF